MDENPWYKTFFGEDYLRIYSFLTPERTEREVDGIVRLLDLPPGSAILDLCCGHGRHALALAKRGYRVTGQDLSEVFLQRAQAEAEAQGVQVRWLQSDMRKIPFESEFDGYTKHSNLMASSCLRPCIESSCYETLPPVRSPGMQTASLCWRSETLTYSPVTAMSR